MYEEPYRWVEAVGNRRTYLDEQFKQGSPVVALAYEGGLLLTTVSKGTPKLYEIYDRIALAGMGHPADLEKLRFNLLEMAHTEGFNRSPSDVTGARLVKYGVAPVIKQAFEEVFKAPFIVKILLAELGQKRERDAFLTIDYDGTFEETTGCAVLAATPAVQKEMTAYLRQEAGSALPLEQAMGVALRTWALGDRAQQHARDESNRSDDPSRPSGPAALPTDAVSLLAHLRSTVGEKMIECALLERNYPGTSKYRTLKVDELGRLLPKDLRPPVTE
jgi:proteasome alpha subunit